MKVGLQLYSITDAAEKDLLATLGKVAEMGYKHVQFANFFGHDAEEIKRSLDEYGLKVAGSHTWFDDLRGDKLEEIIAFNKAIGNDLLICPFITEEHRGSVAAYEKTAAILNDIGEKCHAAGMQLAYHNHNFEFEKIDGTKGFDILFEQTDPRFLKIEMDVYWVAYAGYDPIEMMKKYKSRVVSLHVKDMIGRGQAAKSTEIGNGQLPIQAYLQTAQKEGVAWALVEQEDFTKSPLESVAESQLAMEALLRR